MQVIDFAGNYKMGWGLKFWRRGSESNRRIKVLQTLALPLGYRASIAERSRCKNSAGRAASQSCLPAAIVINSTREPRAPP